MFASERRTLTTFSGVNIEASGKIQFQGGTLDAQYVDIRGGTLSGNGSDPRRQRADRRPGRKSQRDRRAATAHSAVGIGTLSIGGRFANDEAGTIAIDLGGPNAGTQYDRILVDNDAALKARSLSRS